METEPTSPCELQKEWTNFGAAMARSEVANNDNAPDKKHPYYEPSRSPAAASRSAKWRLEPRAGDDAATEPDKCLAITREELWELFNIALAGCGKRISEIEDVYEKDSQEARSERIKVMTAMNRLHAAIVAMWGQPEFRR